MEMLESLLAGVRSACAGFPDRRRGNVTYSMAEIGLSGFSLVFFHGESFTALQQGGYWLVGFFAVLYAERVVPRPPARAGGRPEHVELPKPVRHNGRPH